MSIGIERFIEKHLKRFVARDPELGRGAEELLDMGVPKAEVFRQVANGRGRGKSHISGKQEGILKDS